MRFAPEYVTYVLNENFEDAKALLPVAADGDPLRAPGDARRAGHRLRRASARAPRRARRRSRRTTIRARRRTTAPTRTCSSTSSGCSIEACGEDVAGRLHTARSRNDIDMTMYRMRQREFILGADRRRRSSCARRCSIWPTQHRETMFAAHTHTQRGAADDGRALPARRHRAARARRRAAGGAPTNDEPQSARRVRDHRHRVSDRPPADRATCSASTARPATPTAASRRSTTCSRACRRRSVLLAGLGRFVQDLLLWCTAEFGYLRLRRRLRAGAAASCRRSATRSRSSTRARSAARRSARRRRSSRPSTTRRSATSSTPRTICSRSCPRCSATRMRAVKLVAAAMRDGASSMPRGSRRAPAKAGRR